MVAGRDKTVQWSAATLGLRQLIKEEERRFADADKHAARAVRFKSEHLAEAKQEKRLFAGRRNLERFERAVQFLFTKGGVRLGYLQHRLLQAARIVLLKRMFGSELESEIDYLRTRFGITELHQNVAILFPRRSGKTTVQTIVAACILVSQVDGNVVTFNTRSRQGQMWLAQTVRWIHIFRDSEEFRFKDSGEGLGLWKNEKYTLINSQGSKVCVASLPGPSDDEGSNFRGLGERLMLMNVDEFFFIKESVYPTILPLLNNGAALMLTSSQAKDPESPIVKMIYQKFSNGKDAVLRFDWRQSCVDCKVAGKEDSCTHFEHPPQHFQNKQDQERVKALITPFGNGGYEREMLNMAARTYQENLFRTADLDALEQRDNEYDQPTHMFSHVFIGIDPANEGRSKNMAISIGLDAYHRPPGAPYTYVILGADILPAAATDDMTMALVEHMRALRERPAMARAIFVIIIEANLARIAEDTRRAMLRLSGMHEYVIIAQDPKRYRNGTRVMRTGTRTTHESKESLALALQDLIMRRAIRFNKDFVVGRQNGLEMAPRARIMMELRHFKRELKPPKNRYGDWDTYYIGIADDGGHMTTDCIMAIGFVLLNVEVFLTSPEYANYRRNGHVPGA